MEKSIEQQDLIDQEANWDFLGLSPQSLEVIAKAGYTKPTAVQVQGIPIALEGKDLIASAQTGTGKTATFVLPMIEAFVGRKGTFGLVLAPTREIAQQIDATIKVLGGPLGIESIVLIGGVNMRHDAIALQSYPQIIVATPGRLCDHLDRGNIWLDYIEIVVLDEADRMLDMGFSDQLARITSDLPRQRQTLLFSATITPTVRRLAEKILYQPQSVNIGKPLTAAISVEQRVLFVAEESKNRELHRILRKEPGSVIVFTRSKDGATRVWRSLHSAGFYDATYIHSDRLQSHREQALAEFKEGKYRILIATDVAARGLHIDDVSLVINYDLPMEAEDYVHRIGRTGRAGATGRALTFVTPRDRRGLNDIERLLGRELASIGESGSRDATPEHAPATPQRPHRRRRKPA
ncbi:DEAD/DEAH box helicase [Bdellovibrionota bacterium FG-1]